MESVLIDVDPEKEEMVPRPDPSDAVLAEAEAIIETARADGGILAGFEGDTPNSLAAALSPDEAAAEDVVADSRGVDAADLESAIREVSDDPEFVARTRVGEQDNDDGGDEGSDAEQDATGESDDEATEDGDADDFGGFEPATAVDDGESGDADASDDAGAESGGEAADGGRPVGDDPDEGATGE
jgi:flagellar protein FlaI